MNLERKRQELNYQKIQTIKQGSVADELIEAGKIADMLDDGWELVDERAVDYDQEETLDKNINLVQEQQDQMLNRTRWRK